jgi:hypothetical protein
MCLTPINLKKETLKQKFNDSYHMQQVPCGRCLECRKLRVNSWYVRLSEEKSVSESAYFVTFTYDDDHIPFSDNGLMSLHYLDFQRFCRYIRRRNRSDLKIKYFCVGEYGTVTSRPHYHAIIFNVSDPQLIVDTWKHGHVHIGKVQDASIFYTLKYALKGSWTPKRDPDDDRKPEKALMSKGLGLSYLTPQMVKYLTDDVSRPVTMLGNKKVGIPRYYRDKIFTEHQKKVRVKALEPYMDKRYDQISDPLFPQRVERMYQKSIKYLQKTD